MSEFIPVATQEEQKEEAPTSDEFGLDDIGDFSENTIEPQERFPANHRKAFFFVWEKVYCSSCVDTAEEPLLL